MILHENVPALWNIRDIAENPFKPIGSGLFNLVIIEAVINLEPKLFSENS